MEEPVLEGAEPVGGRPHDGSREKKEVSPTCRHVSRTEWRIHPRHTHQLHMCLAAQTVLGFQGNCHVFQAYLRAVVEDQLLSSTECAHFLAERTWSQRTSYGPLRVYVLSFINEDRQI